MSRLWTVCSRDEDGDLSIAAFSSKEKADACEGELFRSGIDSETHELVIDEYEGFEIGPVYRAFVDLGGKPGYTSEESSEDDYVFRHPEKPVVGRLPNGVHAISPTSVDHAIRAARESLGFT